MSYRFLVSCKAVVISIFLSAGISGLAETTSYGYDVHGRLVGVGHFQGALDGWRDFIYLDNADNRSSYNFQYVAFVLGAGQYYLSPDGRTEFIMQSDGNLVVYFQGSPLWGSGTNGSGANRAAFQSDGNLVLYTASNTAVWGSGTSGKVGAHLVVQNDGNVAIYDVNNLLIWATNTGGH